MESVEQLHKYKAKMIFFFKEMESAITNHMGNKHRFFFFSKKLTSSFKNFHIMWKFSIELLYMNINTFIEFKSKVKDFKRRKELKF